MAGTAGQLSSLGASQIQRSQEAMADGEKAVGCRGVAEEVGGGVAGAEEAAEAAEVAEALFAWHATCIIE